MNIFERQIETNINSISIASYRGDSDILTEVRKLRNFPNIERLSLNFHGIDDECLKEIVEVCPKINNLNLQGTDITNYSIAYLSRLKNLQILRLKDCVNLSSECVSDINQLLKLEDLQIDGTGIDEQGVKYLDLPKLQLLMINEVDQSVAMGLSRKLKDCEITVKGKYAFQNGNLLWER